MRIIFPLAVVSVAAGISPIAAVEVALYEPAAYSAIIEEAHLSIAAFGGVFLMLVALSFFGDADKFNRWIPRVEGVLHQLGRGKVLPPVFALLIAVVFSFALPSAYRMDFLFAAACGVAAFLATDIHADRSIMHIGLRLCENYSPTANSAKKTLYWPSLVPLDGLFLRRSNRARRERATA